MPNPELVRTKVSIPTPDWKQPMEIPFAGIRIPVRDVLRRLGYPYENADRVDPAVRKILEDEMRRVLEMSEPGGMCRFLRVLSRNREAITFQDTDFTLRSEQVIRMLNGSEAVVFFAVTIGTGLERTIDRLLETGEATRAFVLDAVCSETVDALADDLHWAGLQASAEKSGCRPTPRFSPGYGDWPLDVQPSLIHLCGGERIGIRVNSSCLMIPRKSVSAVLGWIRKE